MIRARDVGVDNQKSILGHPDNLFMRGILFLGMQMQGKKRSKIGHLARLFNAADAFSGATPVNRNVRTA